MGPSRQTYQNGTLLWANIPLLRLPQHLCMVRQPN